MPCLKPFHADRGRCVTSLVCHMAFFKRSQLQIPQGLEQSDEDELYEEVEDTREQHSQLTMWCMPCMLNLTAGFKV